MKRIQEELLNIMRHFSSAYVTLSFLVCTVNVSCMYAWNINPNTEPQKQSNRRNFASTILSGCFIVPNLVKAADDEVLVSKKQFLSGTIFLPQDPSVVISDEAALYITCRPDKPDNIPSAILNGTRGKAPPVLSARFMNPSFPFKFNLGEEHLTLEGTQFEWFTMCDLIISARYDQDGVAATRSPDDLVGRSVAFRKDGSYESIQVKLEGRGAFGKFATGAKLK